MRLCAVRDVPLSIDEAIDAVKHPSAGAVALFLGLVRDHNDGREVTLLEYEAYASMAEKQMSKIMDGIEQEVEGVRLAAVHRVGRLEVGDAAIVCTASSAHRGEAFRAGQMLIDRIKADVPVWKREHGPEGPYWVGWEDARCDRDDHDHGHDHGSKRS